MPITTGRDKGRLLKKKAEDRDLTPTEKNELTNEDENTNHAHDR